MRGARVGDTWSTTLEKQVRGVSKQSMVGALGTANTDREEITMAYDCLFNRCHSTKTIKPVVRNGFRCLKLEESMAAWKSATDLVGGRGE